MIQEVLQEIVAVLIKYGVDVELDSAQIEWDHIVAQPMATFLYGEMKGC